MNSLERLVNKVDDLQITVIKMQATLEGDKDSGVHSPFDRLFNEVEKANAHLKKLNGTVADVIRDLEAERVEREKGLEVARVAREVLAANQKRLLVRIWCALPIYVQAPIVLGLIGYAVGVFAAFKYIA